VRQALLFPGETETVADAGSMAAEDPGSVN